MNKEIAQLLLDSAKKLILVQGDITEEKVDAIVNAANSRLQHGGGVAAAIARKGGHTIQEESNEIGFVKVGEAAATSGGNLTARYIIHAVGPRWGEGDEDAKLKNAVLSSLQLGDEKKCASLSMPAISAGIFGFPKDRCAEILIHNIIAYFKSNPDSTLQEVRICLYDQPTMDAFKQTYDKIMETG